jgi:hypothetical protein
MATEVHPGLASQVSSSQSVLSRGRGCQGGQHRGFQRLCAVTVCELALKKAYTCLEGHWELGCYQMKNKQLVY